MSPTPRPSTTRRPILGHAVVLGGSIAGLAAAAALAPRAQRVTVVERDALAAAGGDGPAGRSRRGVPQGVHLHNLLPAGVTAFERLLPGIEGDLGAAGAHVIRHTGQNRVMAGGGEVLLDDIDSSYVLIGATRPLMERVVRDRVRALGNVTFHDGHRALGLEAGPGGRQVAGVRLAASRTGSEETLAAELVVDATGRGSRMPRWLQTLGYEPPREQRLGVDARYTTRLFRRGDEAPAGRAVVFVATLPGGRRQATALAVEGGRWIVSLMGLVGDQAPGDLDGFRAWARSLWASDVSDIVSVAEPLGDAVTGAFPANVRRRYDRLARLPGRLAVLGDGLCATNPHYGRGMTNAALEAVELGHALDRHGPDRAGRAFFRATRRLVDASWDFVTDNDLLQPAIEGRRSLRWRLVTAYSGRVLRASHRDPVVASAFMNVFGMRARPASLLRPGIALRALKPRKAARTAPRRAPEALPTDR